MVKINTKKLLLAGMGMGLLYYLTSIAKHQLTNTSISNIYTVYNSSGVTVVSKDGNMIDQNADSSVLIKNLLQNTVNNGDIIDFSNETYYLPVGGIYLNNKENIILRNGYFTTNHAFNTCLLVKNCKYIDIDNLHIYDSGGVDFSIAGYPRWWSFEIEFSENVNITNSTVINSMESNFRTHVTKNVTFNNCYAQNEITNTWGDLWDLYVPIDSKIENCIGAMNRGPGISIYRGTNIIISNCKISSTGSRGNKAGMRALDYGVVLPDGTITKIGSNNIEFRDCVCQYNSEGFASDQTDVAPEIPAGRNVNIRFINCVSRNNFIYGFDIRKTDGYLLENIVAENNPTNIYIEDSSPSG